MKTTTVIFRGHIIHAKDLDGGDELNIEVMMNEAIPADQLIQKCYEAAEKHEVVTLSGNTFEFEYLMASGRAKKVVITRTETTLSERTPEANELLESMTHA